MDDNAEIKEPEKSAEWLAMIEASEKHFATYNDISDNIDKIYADLSQMRISDDTQFALFWSNIQVMGPSVYARPPKPVVTPKFKDRRPIYRVASEMLERVTSVAFDLAQINDVMLQCRDDLTINGRGVPWVRFDDEDGQRICIEHLDRRDFAHEPARKWADVGWVARRGWLCKDEMDERFGKDIADQVSYSAQRETGVGLANGDLTAKCPVWEIWHREEDQVVWVAEGVEDVLDSAPPHLKLSGFFPCPRPAYATLQRRSLIPVSDYIYYQGQMADIGTLTARISALSAALRLKGFYPGGGEIGDAVERAIKEQDDGAILVPVSSMAAFGSGGDPIVWLPLDVISSTITACVELRRQLIEDVYQIIGLSDIMRGATNPTETLGAQQLKQQNGSYRVRDKQHELVRLARDLVNIVAEIISDQFSRKTLTDMAQMDIPTNAEISAQVKDIEHQAKAITQQVEQAKSDPRMAQEAQKNPDAAKQAMQAAQQQMQQLSDKAKELQDTPTIEDVLDFLHDEKLRPFVLDIETDSTVYPDEMAEKAARAEFLQVFMGAMAGVTQLAALGPSAIGLAGGVLKFALAPYRVGRELEGLIDDFVDSAPQIAEQMAQANSAGSAGGAELAKAQQTLADAKMKEVEVKGMAAQAQAQNAAQKLQLDGHAAQTKAQSENDRLRLEMEKLAASVRVQDATVAKMYADIAALGVKGQVDTAWVALEQQSQHRQDLELIHSVATQQVNHQLAAANQAHQHAMGQTQQAQAQNAANRSMTLAEKQAAKKPSGG